MAFKMKGFTPFTKNSKLRGKINEWKAKRQEKRSERVGERIRTREDRGKDTKRLEDKRFNIDNPWWKSKERELDALGSRPENRPYWQSDYQKKMAKKGITTSGYLDAKYRRRGVPSYAPGAELHGPLSVQSNTSMSREQNLRNRDFRNYM